MPPGLWNTVLPYADANNSRHVNVAKLNAEIAPQGIATLDETMKIIK